MAVAVFVNRHETNVKSIEVWLCPEGNCKDVKIEFGEGKYDHFIIPPGGEESVKTDCNRICWRYFEEPWNEEDLEDYTEIDV